MDIIEFKGKQFPKFQGEGNAAQFAIPFAKHICKGYGYDIGCAKQEWALPGATPIDLIFDDPWHANNLPDDPVDFIFSSHCLEHVTDWVRTLDYWLENLKPEGNLFLYLPDFSQEYWRPWNNTKHQHVFTPDIIRAYLESQGLEKVFVSGVDLNSSFVATAQK